MERPFLARTADIHQSVHVGYGRLSFPLTPCSWRLIEILREEKRDGRSGRFMVSLDVPIEIGRKSVNQFAPKATFQSCGGRAIIAYAANDLPGRRFNRDRNTACLGRKRVARGIRDELPDNQFCSPTTSGIEHEQAL
jgi:hypothetical protein